MRMVWNPVQWKLPKIYAAILMKRPNSELTVSSWTSLNRQMSLSVLGLGYIQLNCWSVVSHRNLQTIQAVAMTRVCCLKTDSVFAFIRATSSPKIMKLFWNL